MNTQTERIVPTVVTAYNSKEPLISLHIPKTGGTSLRTILLRWFPNGQFLEHYPNNGLLPLRHDCRGPVCIHGHFNSTRGFGVAEYYPHASQFITFLRDPFNRICSLCFFLTRQNGVAAAFLRWMATQTLRLGYNGVRQPRRRVTMISHFFVSCHAARTGRGPKPLSSGGLSSSV